MYRQEDTQVMAILSYTAGLNPGLAVWPNFSWRDAMLRLIPLDRELRTDKVRVPPKSNLMNQWLLLGFLTGIWVGSYIKEQEKLKSSCITKAHSSITKLGTKSTLHSSQTAQQAEDCLSQVPRSVWTSFRQLSCFLLLPDRWSSLGVILTCLSDRDSKLLFFTLVGKEEPRESHQFQGLP